MSKGFFTHLSKNRHFISSALDFSCRQALGPGSAGGFCRRMSSLYFSHQMLCAESSEERRLLRFIQFILIFDLILVQEVLDLYSSIVKVERRVKRSMIGKNVADLADNIMFD